MEEREDFTKDDNKPGNYVFPIRLHNGGEGYGFCPGKATWCSETMELMTLLQIAHETGMMPYPGGIYEQPDWFVDLLGWFIPKVDLMKFTCKADMILGGEKPKKSPQQTPKKP